MSLQSMKPRELAAQAMTLWANYIETGNPAMSAESALKCGEKPKPLAREQVEFSQRLRREAREALAHGIR